MKATLLILLVGATVLTDQATKTAALLLLSPGEILPVVPGFNVTLGFNESILRRDTAYLVKALAG